MLLFLLFSVGLSKLATFGDIQIPGAESISTLKLFEHGKRIYDTVVHASQAPFDVKQVLKFIKEGGNYMVMVSTESSTNHVQLVHQFGVTIDPKEGNVQSNDSKTGLGHYAHLGRDVDTVVFAPAVSHTSVKRPIQPRLVSRMQTTTGSRIIVMPLWKDAHEFIPWLSLKTKVAKFNVTHLNEKQVYNINDEINVLVDLQDENGKLDAEVQLTLRMLEVYVRKTFTQKTTVRLPSQPGIYTLTVEFKKPGYNNLVKSFRFPIKQPKHDSFSRFIVVAWPYYTAVFSNIFALIVMCCLFRK